MVDKAKGRCHMKVDAFREKIVIEIKLRAVAHRDALFSRRAGREEIKKARYLLREIGKILPAHVRGNPLKAVGLAPFFKNAHKGCLGGRMIDQNRVTHLTTDAGLRAMRLCNSAGPPPDLVTKPLQESGIKGPEGSLQERFTRNDVLGRPRLKTGHGNHPGFKGIERP